MFHPIKQQDYQSSAPNQVYIQYLFYQDNSRNTSKGNFSILLMAAGLGSIENKNGSHSINKVNNLGYLTIIPQARMGSESIAHEAEGRMGY